MSKIIKNAKEESSGMHPIFQQICNVVKHQKSLKTAKEESCLYFIKTDIEIYGKISEETKNVCKVQNFEIPKQYNKYL
jgi:hypothetical protein